MGGQGEHAPPENVENVDCEARHLDCIFSMFNFALGGRGRGLRLLNPPPGFPLETIDNIVNMQCSFVHLCIIRFHCMHVFTSEIGRYLESKCNKAS